ncbi:MAG: hypothetical protein AAFP03_17440 [Cyanobacteria bacterium J06598_3]
MHYPKMTPKRSLSFTSLKRYRNVSQTRFKDGNQLVFIPRNDDRLG